MIQRMLLFFLLILISGCSGRLYTVINPVLPSDGTKVKIQGVLVYDTVNVIEVYKTTILIDKSSGNQLGSVASSSCIPDLSIKFSTRTDYSKPNIIAYEPGFLETNKFGISMDKGVLTSVNIESNPTESLKNISTLMPYVASEKTASKIVTDGKPLCNAGPRFIGVYKAPDILPNSQLDSIISTSIKK